MSAYKGAKALPRAERILNARNALAEAGRRVAQGAQVAGWGSSPSMAWGYELESGDWDCEFHVLDRREAQEAFCGAYVVEYEKLEARAARAGASL